MGALKFFLASANEHKAQEFSKLFNSDVIQVQKSPEKLEVLEDGTTFFQNSLKKAETYFKNLKAPVMSDDSGLIVEALPEELGVQTARFGGEGLTDRARSEFLLEKMVEIPEEKRTAFFVCVLCFYLSPDEVFFFEGRLKGKISRDYRGEAGFGYDPVFLPEKKPDQTLSEIPEWKEKNSHRAQACQYAEGFFRERVGQNS